MKDYSDIHRVKPKWWTDEHVVRHTSINIVVTDIDRWWQLIGISLGVDWQYYHDVWNNKQYNVLKDFLLEYYSEEPSIQKLLLSDIIYRQWVPTMDWWRYVTGELDTSNNILEPLVKEKHYTEYSLEWFSFTNSDETEYTTINFIPDFKDD